MKIEIFDTTLRDGAQGAGVMLSPDDKLNIIRMIDSLGIDYIEVSMITDSRSADFFRQAASVPLTTSRLCTFSPTVRPHRKANEDELLRYAAEAPADVAVLYGKASLLHVNEVLRTDAEENLRIIHDSIAYLVSLGKTVIFDAEHFFDGYGDNPDYAMKVLESAKKAGAHRLVLCDTNGGMLPDVVGMTVSRVAGEFGGVGIHCHNDMGMADASSVSAVLSGACHVQCTVSGIGERCGGASLSTIVPLLQLKLGFDCIGDKIRSLTPAVRSITESANLTFNESAPFVGGHAFTHKAGTHIDGIRKSPRSFEHIDPESVGNYRETLISSLSGRSALAEKIRACEPGAADKNSPEVGKALELLKAKEAEGYMYEDADASLVLLIDGVFGRRKSYFELGGFKIIVDNPAEQKSEMNSTAMIKIRVEGKEEITAAEGNGPVNAMDAALRRALTCFYPDIDKMKLTDYKVRVIDSRATASSVRVVIESTDGRSTWRTVGVSPDITGASWQALCDSVEYMLSHICKI